MQRSLRLLGVGAGVRGFGLSLAGPFIALYLHNSLGISFATIGIVFLGVGVLPILTLTFGGFLTDRIGRRRLLIVSILAEGVATIGVAFAMLASSFTGVVAALGVLATVSTLGGPALSAYVADLAEGSERTQAYTWTRIGHNAGFSAGVSAGGFAVLALGFPRATFLGAAFGVATAVLLALWLAPSPYDLGLRAPQSTTVVTRNRRSLRDSVRALAQDRVFLAVSAGAMLCAISISQWNVTFPLFVNARLGLDYGIIGIGLALNGVIVVFGQTATTNLAIGRRHTTLWNLGTVIYVLAFLALGLDAVTGFFPVAAFLFVVLILTIGENVGSIPMQTLASNMAPPSEIGAYNGAYFTFLGVGALIAFAVGGFALQSISDPILLWIVLCIPAIPGILITRWAGARIPARANRA